MIHLKIMKIIIRKLIYLRSLDQEIKRRKKYQELIAKETRRREEWNIKKIKETNEMFELITSSDIDDKTKKRILKAFETK